MKVDRSYEFPCGESILLLENLIAQYQFVVHLNYSEQDLIVVFNQFFLIY